MTTVTVRSKLQEVLDQLSLDKAEGKHLNKISGNYGLDRPLFGFDDATWRAVIKILALQHRQIANKFRDILALLLGPQKTFATNLANNHEAGALILSVYNTKQLPQVGTVILDRGQSTEESIRYTFVDYESDVIFLETPTLYDHVGVSHDAEETLLQAALSATVAVVTDSEAFPTSAFPKSILLGRGTPTEESLLLQGNNTSTNTLTVTTTTKEHIFPELLSGVTYTSHPYSTSSFVLLVNNAGVLPDSGVLFIDGTAVKYSSRDLKTHTINLTKTLSFTVPQGTLVQAIGYDSLATLAGVQVLGAGWDVVQATPRLVELLIPTESLEEQDLYTASYLHPENNGPYTGTMTSAATIGSTLLQTSDVSSWPKAGTVLISNTEYVGYSIGTRINELYIPFGLRLNHNNGDSIEYYSPMYIPPLESGDPASLYAYPGPYLYDATKRSENKNSITGLAQQLAAPTLLSLDVVAGAGPVVVELEDASYFPLSGTFSLSIGEELFTATALYLKGASSTTLATNYSSGAMSITVVSSAGFPPAKNFRVLIGGSNPEIAYVTIVSGNTLTIESGLQFSKSSGDFVRLIADCVIVPQIDVDHFGVVSYSNRRPIGSSPFPIHLVPAFDFVNAEKAVVSYPSIAVNDGTGFSLGGGFAIISSGKSDEEAIEYSSRTGDTLYFDESLTVVINHGAGNEIGFSETASDPSPFGFDYPFRMPLDSTDRFSFLIELVRAAGVQVKIIHRA